MEASAPELLFLRAVANGIGKYAAGHDSAARCGQRAEVSAQVRGTVTVGSSQYALGYRLDASCHFDPPKLVTANPKAAEVLAIALSAVGARSRKAIREALADPPAIDEGELDAAKALIRQLARSAAGTRPVFQCSPSVTPKLCASARS